MDEIKEKQELPVLVLPDMVLLHETNMNLKITKKMGEKKYTNGLKTMITSA